jgi:hypothetical protein
MQQTSYHASNFQARHRADEEGEKPKSEQRARRVSDIFAVGAKRISSKKNKCCRQDNGTNDPSIDKCYSTNVLS